MIPEQINDYNDYKYLDTKSIMAHAKQLLSGKWNKAALMTLIYFLITGGFSNVPHIGGLFGLILTGPMSLGFTTCFLKISNSEPFEFEDLFRGFHFFIKALIAHILILIFIVLWSLLLLVPGIIAALSYSLTYFVILENPNISANNARIKSKELMMGHKMELFKLCLRFWGWFLLCIPTCGVGFLWLFPYIMVSMALFYKKVSALNIKPHHTQPVEPA